MPATVQRTVHSLAGHAQLAILAVLMFVAAVAAERRLARVIAPPATAPRRGPAPA